MSKLSERQTGWRALPLVRFVVSQGQFRRAERIGPCFRLVASAEGPAGLPLYLLDLSPLFDLPDGSLDDEGVLSHAPDGSDSASYNPLSIAQYALAHWNAYLATGGEAHKQEFMAQARWLVAHEVCLDNGVGGWLFPYSLPDFYTSEDRLSALVQGSSISVLVRAYQLAGDDAFLQAAHRAVRAFELDILDGGVSVEVGKDGVFFEAVTVYPAAHILHGFIPALFGLYDYVALTGDAHIAALIDRSLVTLHALLDQFDTGYWTRYDLLHRRLASPFHHELHVTLLAALARLSGCQHCAVLAARWAGYQHQFSTRLRYFIVSQSTSYRQAFWRRAQRFFRASLVGPHLPDAVCVPITAFPIAGGMRGVLAGVAQVMADEWCLEYLAGVRGEHTEGYVIQSFGHKGAMYWQFPNVWLYVLAGCRKLISLLQTGRAYRLILPQDGVYTGAFSALVGRLAGVRVVCMDHGAVTLPYSQTYHAERTKALQEKRWPSRLLSRLRLSCYWPSLKLLARLAARYTDQFLVAGDEVEEVYIQRLGIHASRIVRYPYVVDVHRYAPPGPQERESRREQQGIAADAIVITMINRLAVEKGIHIALQGISQALSRLAAELRTQVQVVIAGDGPLRAQVEAWIHDEGLSACCVCWGEATPADVELLLSITDIFLYTGIRGTNYSMAVLEAMAAGCAVIASMEPRSNERLLAEGRGIAVPAGDAQAVSAALVQAINDGPLCRQMGRLARGYIAARHSAEALRRCLLQATYWPVNHAHDASGRGPGYAASGEDT